MKSVHQNGTPSFRLRLLLVLAVFLFNPAHLSAADSVAVARINLQAGGGTIRADLFEQSGEKKRRVVLVLHGAGGTLLDGPEMRRVARRLAEAGNAVYVVHYFDRTRTLFARDRTMQRNFQKWLQTVRDSITAIQERRGDSRPVGIYGYSLGGFLAILAASDNGRVAAVVEQAGGVWNGKMDRIGKMPAVLMVHGERDGRVRFSKYARPLLPVLRQRATAVETRFFAEEGHAFTPGAMNQVREATVKFFRQRLR